MKTGRRWRVGFTLIEMMVVLVLLTLVVAGAVPAYHAHVRRAHRVEAQTALLQAAHRLERQATATGAYPAGELPEALATAASGRYRITRTTPTSDLDAATRFTLNAVPQGVQAQDPCGTLTLNSAGERGVVGNQASAIDCWHR